MRKLVLLGILFGILIGYLLQPVEPPRPAHPTPENVSEALESTGALCGLNRKISGTAVILDTGYVITASHVLDTNFDGKIGLNEKRFYLKCFGENYGFYPLEVVFADELLDFAILKFSSKTRRPPVFGMSVAKLYTQPGHRVFTIGATTGEPPTITDGYVSVSEDLSESLGVVGRASCYISSGNSGGGVFNSRNKLIGIARAVGAATREQQAMVQIPEIKDGKLVIKTIIITIPVRLEVNSRCYYIPVEAIQIHLEENYLGFLLNKPDETRLYDILMEPFNYGLIKTTTQVGFLFLLLIYFRRHIFS